ncbi:hypothetical protein Q3G72_022123 [Acer saccharum]|nr:hypothetical protein Q3G72_022123 [Acer saccharum]
MNSSAWIRERNEVVVWIRDRGVAVQGLIRERDEAHTIVTETRTIRHKHIVFSNFGDVFCLTARYLVEEFPKAALLQDLTVFYKQENTHNITSQAAYKFNSNPLPQPLCHDGERSALLRFKESLSIDCKSASGDPSAYSKTALWNLEEDMSDCCSWDGVECNEDTGYVIELDLDCKLEGQIPSEILQLTRNNSIFNW